MTIRLLATLVFMLALTALANAQTWTSPDGFLSITPPDVNHFELIPTPPYPFIAIWISNDETTRLGVMKVQIPPDLKLLQSSAEEGLGEEIGGKVTRLPTKILSGHEVWSMTARGESTEFSQAMIRHHDALYKLIAVTTGDHPDSATVNHFFDSLTILQPPTKTEESPDAQSAPDSGNGLDLHTLSKKVGGFGGLLGIGLLVYFLLRSRTNAEGN